MMNSKVMSNVKDPYGLTRHMRKGFQSKANSKGGIKKKSGMLANFDYKQLKDVMQIKDITGFSKYGKMFKKNTGRYIYIDNGADVLAIAHTDSRLDFNHFKVLNLAPDTLLWGANLDNRLGLYYILHYLPSMGYKFDILLTEGEEEMMSSARGFNPPEGKQYNWMFSFDFRGDGVALYDFKDKLTESRLTKAGYIPNELENGTYSDIMELEHLGCKGFNFGCGILGDYHSPFTHASVYRARRSLVRFTRFYNANVTHHLKHTPSSVYVRYPEADIRFSNLKKTKNYEEANKDYVDYMERKKEVPKQEHSKTEVTADGRFVIGPSEDTPIPEARGSTQKKESAKIITLNQDSCKRVRNINTVLRDMPKMSDRIKQCREFIGKSEDEMRLFILEETKGKVDVKPIIIKAAEMGEEMIRNLESVYSNFSELQAYISFLARRLCIPEEVIVSGPDALEADVLTILYPIGEASADKWNRGFETMKKYIKQESKLGKRIIVQDPWYPDDARAADDNIHALTTVYGPRVDKTKGKQLGFKFGTRTTRNVDKKKIVPKIKLNPLSKPMVLVKGRGNDGKAKQYWASPGKEADAIRAAAALQQKPPCRILKFQPGFTGGPVGTIKQADAPAHIG